MKLTYNELRKKEVINIVDGKSFGFIIDLELDFPVGILTGITVQGKKVCPLLSIFNRCKLYISQSEIIKIGGDVILVNINCGGACSPNVNLTRQNNSHKKYCPPPCPPCPPCPPGPPPKFNSTNINGTTQPTVEQIFGNDYDNM